MALRSGTREVGSDASLLIVLLDTHPMLWDAPAPPHGAEAGCALTLGYAGCCEALLVFLNAFLMPLVVGFLVALAATALPEASRLKGGRLWLTVGICALVAALGVLGGVAGLS